ncbi:MAG: cytochrome c biogenesis protein CcdA [Acidimicrobiales bacterium]
MSGLAAIQADPLGLLVAFGAGMLSFLSPCVLPLVPAYLSMVSGLTAAELGALGPVSSPRPADVVAGPDGATASAVTTDPGPGPGPDELRRQRSRLLRGILAFIAGFTVVFTILGASASSLGQLFLTHQHVLEVVSGALIMCFGAVLVAMAAGVVLPMALAGEKRFIVRPSMLGDWAPPIMGMAFAFAWTPCIGPVLGSVLALAAGTGGSAAGGIALLLAYSFGLGVPFLLSGIAFGRMTDLVAKVRGRLRIVDLVGGVILVVFGLLLVTGNVDILSAHISSWLRALHLDRLSNS